MLEALGGPEALHCDRHDRGERILDLVVQLLEQQPLQALGHALLGSIDTA